MFCRAIFDLFVESIQTKAIVRSADMHIKGEKPHVAMAQKLLKMYSSSLFFGFLFQFSFCLAAKEHPNLYFNHAVNSHSIYR